MTWGWFGVIASLALMAASAAWAWAVGLGFYKCARCGACIRGIENA